MKKILSRGVALFLGAVIAICGISGGHAQDKNDEKKKKLSDRTVRVIMGTAFAGLPETLPTPGGKTVKLDRSDPNKFLIPMDEAREIIVHAVLSARAQLCGLEDLQRKHFENIMRHELGRKKWTSEQMTYIDVLHATTGVFMTGSQAVGDEAKKPDDPSKDYIKTYKCSAEERERVKESVENDIKSLAQAK